jgi:Flp pilus assembly protein TadG
MRTRHYRARRGGAAVELAVSLPVLAFLMVITIDFARVFHHALVLTNCARNGAVYGSYNPDRAVDTAGITTAARKDAGDLPEVPGVTSVTGMDAAGIPYVRVTVTCPFRTVTNYPGVPAYLVVSRTVQMRVIAVEPENSTY